jgi:kinesin family protein 2/24
MTIIDLAGKSASDLLNGRAPLRILDDATGTTQVVNAAERRVNGLDEMEQLLEQAASHRRTESTLKNDASSRSL